MSYEQSSVDTGLQLSLRRTWDVSAYSAGEKKSTVFLSSHSYTTLHKLQERLLDSKLSKMPDSA